MSIKGIAFDLEGTIINVEKVHFDAFILAAKDFGLEVDFETIVREIPRALGGGDKLNSEGLSRLSQGKIPAHRILKRKREHYAKLITSVEQIDSRPGFMETLCRIKGMGLETAIGSLTITEQAHYLLERSGLAGMFEPANIVLAEDVRNLKPAPDVYLETAQRMGIAPEEQLVFEDSTSGIIAARTAGSKVVVLPVYTFPDNLGKIVKENPDRVFWDWREINIRALIENLNA